MAFFSEAGKLWLYSGVTMTNASAAASLGDTAAEQSRRLAPAGCPKAGNTVGSGVSARSTRSKVMSSRCARW